MSICLYLYKPLNIKMQYWAKDMFLDLNKNKQKMQGKF